MKIFIAGCARSGTTLIQKLMQHFDGCSVLGPESPVTAFEDFPNDTKHTVIKRTSWCHEVLAHLPSDVALIYCVRHPFDVLTSSHPKSKHSRPFYVTPERWRDEYQALRALQLRQPRRQIFYLHYEDLVENPDNVQDAIAARLGLVPASKFSSDSKNVVHSRSLRKWESQANFRRYLRSLKPWLLKSIASFCVEFGYALPSDFSAMGEVRSNRLCARRLIDQPIIRPDMLPDGLGDNINGPSLIEVPSWINKPLGKYYLYFAHHEGDHIRLAYADRLEGPWRIHKSGTLHLADAPSCHNHIASPDVHVDDKAREVRMIFHGPVRGSNVQLSFLATSPYGLTFSASPVVLAKSNLRAVRWNNGWLGITFGVHLHYSKRLDQPFRRFPSRGFDCYPDGTSGRIVRHVALRATQTMLQVFYNRIGDTPEEIWRCRVDLRTLPYWRVRDPQLILSPERTWEGASLNVRASHRGIARRPENALRDPCIFFKDEKTYLLYAVAGEQGIAIAELENQKTSLG